MHDIHVGDAGETVNHAEVLLLCISWWLALYEGSVRRPRDGASCHAGSYMNAWSKLSRAQHEECRRCSPTEVTSRRQS